MPSELDTMLLHQLIDRLRGGDSGALDELLQRSARRLEWLARSMLRRFPSVRQHEQTGDVVQEAMLSLVGALKQLSFADTREFFGLAAEHIRRRLLDLNRRHAQPRRNHQPLPDVAEEDERLAAPDADEDEMERWAALHEAVATLPAAEREVFSLRWYHGWGVQEIADLLQVSPRTVTRLWFRAQFRLTERLAGRPLPGDEPDR